MYSTTSAIKKWADTYTQNSRIPLSSTAQIQNFFILDNKICSEGEIYISQLSNEGLVVDTLPVQFGKVSVFRTYDLHFKHSAGFPTESFKIIICGNKICNVLDLQKVCLYHHIHVEKFNVLTDIILPQNKKNESFICQYDIKLCELPSINSIDFINIDTDSSNIDLELQFSKAMDFNVLKNLKKIKNIDLRRQCVDSFAGIENFSITGNALINCTNINDYNNIEKMYCNKLQLNYINDTCGLLNILFAHISVVIQPSTLQKSDYRIHEILEKYINNITLELRQEYIMDCLLEFIDNKFTDISL